MRAFTFQSTRRSRQSESTSGAKSPRAGFTLLELLMVVTIIAILIALILPAVAGVVTSARVAQANTDISGLAFAITEFKSKHNVYPPSNITLSEAGGSWTADAQSKIRGMFGTSFDFTIDRDINGDGDMTDTLILNGAECLVFFVGGMINVRASNTDPIALGGFSNNPANPFSRTGQTKERSSFEFKNDRFTDLDGDGMPEYKDPLPDQTAPYWYVESTSYRTAALLPADPQYTPDFFGSTLTKAYSNGADFHNRDSFQIISPGYDTLYGLGGVAKPDDSSALALDDLDNLTNFNSGGTLEN